MLPQKRRRATGISESEGREHKAARRIKSKELSDFQMTPQEAIRYVSQLQQLCDIAFTLISTYLRIESLVKDIEQVGTHDLVCYQGPTQFLSMVTTLGDTVGAIVDTQDKIDSSAIPAMCKHVKAFVAPMDGAEVIGACFTTMKGHGEAAYARNREGKALPQGKVLESIQQFGQQLERLRYGGAGDRYAPWSGCVEAVKASF